MQTSEETRTEIESCAHGAHEGTLNFGQVVGRLTAVSVESYHADYRRAEITYYLPTGDTHVVALPMPDVAIPEAFEAAVVHEAIVGSQRGEVWYPEFLRRTQAAGCVGYVVWIAGRQVQYFGRRGEVHVERFPDRV